MRYAVATPACRRQGFRVMVSGNFCASGALGTPCARVRKASSKNNKNWYARLADFEVPNAIQSRHELADGDIDGPAYEKSAVLRAVNVNWNDDGWNVNANSVENPNRWNADNRIFSRNYCVSPVPTDLLGTGVLLCSPFFHPPSCRPISSSFKMSSEYFPVRMSLLSHAICRKNFVISRCEMVCESMTIFSEGGR